jgi:hypothetical protein
MIGNAGPRGFGSFCIPSAWGTRLQIPVLLWLGDRCGDAQEILAVWCGQEGEHCPAILRMSFAQTR